MGNIFIFFITLVALGAKHIAYYKIFRYVEQQSALVDFDRSSLYCFRPHEGPRAKGDQQCLPQRLDHHSSGSRWPLAMCQIARAALESMPQSDFLRKEAEKCH